MWQTLQSPAATGPWRNSLFVLLFSWQEKQSAEVVGLRIWNFASDWCGSWQAMQSPIATGPWMNLPCSFFCSDSWQMKQRSLPLAAIVKLAELCFSGV